MYKLLTSSRGTDDLSIGFDRSRDRRRDELTTNKNVTGKNHLRIELEDIFLRTTGKSYLWPRLKLHTNKKKG